MHLVTLLQSCSYATLIPCLLGTFSTLLSPMFLLTKTLQVPVSFFFFFPVSLFEDTYNFLTHGSNYCTCAGVLVELPYSWGLWKCPLWMFIVPAWCLCGVSDIPEVSHYWTHAVLICTCTVISIHIKPIGLAQNKHVGGSLGRNMEALDWEGKLLREVPPLIQHVLVNECFTFVSVKEYLYWTRSKAHPVHSSALPGLALVRCGCPCAAVEGIKAVKPCSSRLPGGSFLKCCLAVKSYTAWLLYICISEGL